MSLGERRVKNGTCSAAPEKYQNVSKQGREMGSIIVYLHISINVNVKFRHVKLAGNESGEQEVAGLTEVGVFLLK